MTKSEVLKEIDQGDSFEAQRGPGEEIKSDLTQIEDGLATNLPSKSIKAIDKTTVHRICSGQVVLTLATAVKELVENSIDAGATTVEVRLIEHGSATIEVTDHGKGVEPSDFEGLTLKHHTSKLQDFSDLVGVKTFGFRGEALSSLCALSNLTIVTRHSTQPVGTKLVYNTNGKLIEKIPVSRQVGTTVSLQNLFYTLPVRHKEFLRNLKKEFNKMVQVLYSYCLITTEVRIVCTNQVGKNGRTTVVSTESKSSLRDNISSIFGPKQVSTLLEIEQADPNEEILNEYNVTSECKEKLFRLEGFVSSCAHGKGRSSSDRQFYFINNRPCDPAKVIRLVNDVYHHYNKSQSPMVVLNIRMEEGDVDVNVTPDKRQILVSREKLLLATIKTTLIRLYEGIPSTMNVNGYSFPSFVSPTVKNDACSPSSNSKLSSLSQRFSRSPFGTPGPGSSPLSSKNNRSSYSGVKRSLSSNSESHSRESFKQPRLQDYSFQLNANEKEKSLVNVSLTEKEEISIVGEKCKDESNNLMSKLHENGVTQNQLTCTGFDNENDETCEVANYVTEERKRYNINTSTNISSTPKTTPREIHLKTDSFLNSLKAKKHNNPSMPAVKSYSFDELSTKQESNKLKESETEISSIKELDDTKITYDDENDMRWKPAKTKSISVNFSIDSLKARLKKGKSNLSGSESVEGYRKFRAQISPTDNQTAEEELKKEISKDSFKKMEILGQFNLGFIIARLNSDLFIIDQHATDEKYNFETLQKTCILQSQKLIIPQTLELTATNEGILTDNMEIFIKNGFEFQIDDAKEVGRRVMLTTMPHSRGWEFTKEDVEEMIFMLSDSPGIMCRPSRVNSMFASRACRKSVMIGTHLTCAQMKKLVDHMAEIEQPWNCPHGRPTIRHLIDLNVLKLD